MNDKNKQRHMAYEAMMVLMQIALLTFIIRLWPILLLMILGIFVAALRLLFLSSKKIEPVKPMEAFPPSAVPPTEPDMEDMAYFVIQRRITQILQEKYPDWNIDGEMQVNIALDKELRDKKYPFSRLNGMEVNTLIFPCLNTANTTIFLTPPLLNTSSATSMSLSTFESVHDE